MDALSRCKAMEAFCRQRARTEGEVAGFWLLEADLWRDRLASLSKTNRGESTRKKARAVQSHPVIEIGRLKPFRLERQSNAGR
jgi:hypothetical protein